MIDPANPLMYAPQAIPQEPQRQEDEDPFVGLGHVDDSTIRWLTSTQDLLEMLEHRFRAETFDIQTQKWVKKEKAKPYMNELGIHDVMTEMEAKIQRVNMTTLLGENDVKRICRETSYGLTQLIYLKWEEYEIDKANVDQVIRICVDLIESISRKSLKAGDRTSIFGSLRVGENKGQPGMFSRMLNRGAYYG